MTFRDFVEEMKDAIEAQARGAGPRPLTPMLHLQSRDGTLDLVAIESAWFQSPDAKRRLVYQMVVPLVQERQPVTVAWSFTTTFAPMGGAGDFDAVCLTVIDGERHEIWLAPLANTGEFRYPSSWHAWPPNQQDGLLLTPIQEALR